MAYIMGNKHIKMIMITILLKYIRNRCNIKLIEKLGIKSLRGD